MEKLSAKREDVREVKRRSEGAKRYFGHLLRESREQARVVERVDLEGVSVPAVAQGVEAGIMV